MKREKRLTKRERKAQNPRPAQAHTHEHEHHIHCISCGRHINADEFDSGHAKIVTCQHRSQFAACAECESRAIELLAEHDRTGQPVRSASAWH